MKSNLSTFPSIKFRNKVLAIDNNTLIPRIGGEVQKSSTPKNSITYERPSALGGVSYATPGNGYINMA
jgi:hypothetical protein